MSVAGKLNVKCQACGKTIYYKKGNKPKICECKALYSLKPKYEYELLTLQDEYIEKNRDPKVFEKMYPLLYLYIKKLIFQKMKNRTSIDSSSLEDKVQTTICILLSRYKESCEFKVAESFAGYLSQILLGVLYNKKTKRNDKNLSLDFKMDAEGNNSEVINNLFKLNSTTLAGNEFNLENEIINKLNALTSEIIEYISIANLKLMDNDFSFRERLDFLYGMYFILSNYQERRLRKYKNAVSKNMVKLLESTQHQIYMHLKSEVS